MTTFHEEAAQAHGAADQRWSVAFYNTLSGEERTCQLGATSYQQAINKGSDRLTMATLGDPQGSWYFRRCVPKLQQGVFSDPFARPVDPSALP